MILSAFIGAFKFEGRNADFVVFFDLRKIVNTEELLNVHTHISGTSRLHIILIQLVYRSILKARLKE